MWNEEFDWEGKKPQWVHSSVAGDVFWQFVLYPRIQAFVPAGRVLEIAPGYGRWSDYLKDLCDELILIDLAEKCIEACRKRFAAYSHIRFHVNDGRSLEFCERGSVDFVFSFDSLVHCDRDAMDGYMQGISRILSPDGVAFIHHSNVAAYSNLPGKNGACMPGRGRRSLLRRLLGAGRRSAKLSQGWRSPEVSAGLIAQQCNDVGLCCITQEIINWTSSYKTDALSTIVHKGCKWERENRIIDNPEFLAARQVIQMKMKPYVYGRKEALRHFE